MVRAYHHLSEAEAFLFRMQSLLEHRDMDGAMRIFHALPAALQLPVGREFAMWAMDSLAGSFAGDRDEMDLHLCSFQVALSCLPTMTRVAMCDGQKSVAEQLTQWRTTMLNIYQLLLQFGILVSAEEYSCDSHRRQV